ncbi:transcription elongation regulator 1 [Paragonimus westermani]|uniref:Transcription elongation regulator 1 n=1 Tax=Paragonimus westermani TaxID=34504 RepID=A0A5J4NNN7_9TREM|nr:transcription elongation regulator 1 [Paragonimus westermani]
MSAEGDGSGAIEQECAAEPNFQNNEVSFNQDESFEPDDSQFDKEDSFKPDERLQMVPASRPMRPMRHQGPHMQFRPGPGSRPPYSLGFRGPRVPLHMAGNPHGMPFMRPGMGPNRSGPPFDGYGPPMGMPRGPPPRHPHFQPRYPSMMENHTEEEMEDPMQSYNEMNTNEFDGQPPNSGAYQNMPPNMRPRGPPPQYMMGPHGAPPASSAPGGPFTGPGQPYNGPPFAGSGPAISTTGGPPFNAPGPAYNAPTSGRSFTGPPGPPFSGPHAPVHCGPQGSNFTGPCGPPSNSGMAMPSSQDFGGPNPTHSFNGPPFPGPPFSNMSRLPFSAPPPSMPPSGAPPSGPPSVPSTGPPMPPTGPTVQQNLSVGQPQPGPPSDVPSSVSQFSPSQSFGVPSAPPLTTSSTAVTVTSNSTLPPMCPPPVPHPPVTSMSPGFGFHSSMPMPEVMPFAVPPGFPTPPGVVSRPLVGQPPMPHQPLGPAPTAPFHMMPPPVSTMPMIPPSIPPFRPPMPFMPPMPMGAAQHNFSQKTDDIWVENLTAEGKSYYYNMRTRETRWDRPDGVAVVRQGEVEGAPKPANTTPTSVPVTAGGSSKPPEVAVWSEYHNPEGKAYYYNSKTGETTWEKPKVLLEWGEQQEKVTTVQNTPEQPSAPVATSTVKSEAPVVKAKSSEPSVTTAETSEVKPSLEVKEDLNKKVSAEKTVEAPVFVAEKKEEVKTPKDNSRPVSSTAVPGTPWCVVWTGDDRAFFFNPSQRLSVWEKPEELKGRVDVDRLLEKQPTKSNVSDGEKSTEEQVNQVTGESAPKKPRMDDDERVVDSQKDSEILKNGTANDADVELDKTAPLDKIPVGMEAAREAEERAARERAVQPLEVRVRRFREMLVEMQVSAFSTWEKELHKIVFDPRYLLLASKERKQTFEAYVKERAEEERREKKNKMKERKEKFVELLQEAGLTSTSSFNEFSAKYAKDERFKGIEKSRERETLFQDMLAEVRKREKDEKHREKEKTKADFLNLLKEQKYLSRHSHWGDIKRRIDTDPRYKAVDSSSRREDWFRDFIRKLEETPPAREDSGSRKEREKKERQEASIREREREVKEALSTSLKERDKEREQQLHSEQEQNFRTLLTELVRDPNITWKETKKILRKDARWELISDVLQRSERDDIFKEHLSALSKKSRDVKLVTDNDARDRRHSLADADDRVDEVDKKVKSSSKDSSRR